MGSLHPPADPAVPTHGTSTVDGGPGRGAWHDHGDRLVAGALLLGAATLVGYQVLIGELIVPLAFNAAAFAAVGVLNGHRAVRWRRWLAAGLALAYLVGGFPFLVANLAHPASPLSFLFEAAIALVCLVTIAGVASARVDGPEARATARRAIVIVAVAFALVAALVSAVAVSAVEGEAARPGDVPVEAVRSRFPEQIEVPADTSALWVDNQDPVHHTLVIDGTDIRAVLPASSAVRVPIDELDPGTYRFLCDVPGHEAMVGELEVG